jgi:hypothetical protein
MKKNTWFSLGVDQELERRQREIPGASEIINILIEYEFHGYKHL